MVSWWQFKRPHSDGGLARLQTMVVGAGLVVVVIVAAQLLGSSWYMGRMLPGTVIGDHAVGGLTLPQAHAFLQSRLAKAHISLVISNQTFQFTPSAVGARYDINASLRRLYNAEHQSWSLVKPNRSEPLSYHLDSSTLIAVVDKVAGSIGVAPVDAGLVVTAGQVKTLPDKNGYTVNRIELARLIETHLGSGTSVTLAAVPSSQTASIVASALAGPTAAAQAVMAVPISLNYAGKTWTPSQATIGSWLGFTRSNTDDGRVTLLPVADQSKVKSYVQSIANQVDVPAVNQLQTITSGVTAINQVGANGTVIDQDATVAAVIAALTARTAINATITDHPVAFKTLTTNFTVLDYPKYIEVNLSKQHAWVWQAGQIIYDTPITSGATGAGYPTVTGLFAIYYKTTNTHLIGNQYGPRYNYDVAVKYWMPFYSGYGLHDASWRNGNFGGSDYWRGGSHGCVNLPDAAAEYIYNWSDIGTPVWVHN